MANVVVTFFISLAVILTTAVQRFAQGCNNKTRALLFWLFIPNPLVGARCRELTHRHGHHQENATPTTDIPPSRAIVKHLDAADEKWRNEWFTELSLGGCFSIAFYHAAVRLPLIGSFVEQCFINTVASVSYLDAIESNQNGSNKESAPSVTVIRCNKNFGLYFFVSQDNSDAQQQPEAQPNNEQEEQRSPPRCESTSSSAGTSTAASSGDKAQVSQRQEERYQAQQQQQAEEEREESGFGRRAASSSASPQANLAASPDQKQRSCLENFSSTDPAPRGDSATPGPTSPDLLTPVSKNSTTLRGKSEEVAFNNTDHNNISSDKLDLSGELPIGVNANSSVQQQQQQTTTTTITYIWIDAVSTRSSIPMWWSSSWKQHQQREQTSAAPVTKHRHCQLVALREASDAVDAAGMLASPHSPENSVAAFPAAPGQQSVVLNDDGSAAATATAVADQSSRALTEALAEGIVSAWSLVAKHGLDVNSIVNTTTSNINSNSSSNAMIGSKSINNNSNKIMFVACGYEAAAAVILAATSTTSEMRRAFAGCVFFDAVCVDRPFVRGQNHPEGSGFQRALHSGATTMTLQQLKRLQQSIREENAEKQEAPFSALSDSRAVSLPEELWRSLRVPVETLENKLQMQQQERERNNNSPSLQAAAMVAASANNIQNNVFLDGSSGLSASMTFSRSGATPISPSGKSALKRTPSGNFVASNNDNNNNNNNARGGGNNTGYGTKRKPIFRVPSVQDWSHVLDTSRSTTPTRDTASALAAISPGSNTSLDEQNYQRRNSLLQTAAEEEAAAARTTTTTTSGALSMQLSADQAISAASGISSVFDPDSLAVGDNTISNNRILLGASQTVNSPRFTDTAGSTPSQTMSNMNSGAGSGVVHDVQGRGEATATPENIVAPSTATADLDPQQRRVFTNAARSGELHVADRFFRDDMRSVAARAQLSRGVFVLANSRRCIPYQYTHHHHSGPQQQSAGDVAVTSSSAAAATTTAAVLLRRLFRRNSGSNLLNSAAGAQRENNNQQHDDSGKNTATSHATTRTKGATKTDQAVDPLHQRLQVSLNEGSPLSPSSNLVRAWIDKVRHQSATTTTPTSSAAPLRLLLLEMPNLRNGAATLWPSDSATLLVALWSRLVAASLMFRAVDKLYRFLCAVLAVLTLTVFEATNKKPLENERQVGSNNASTPTAATLPTIVSLVEEVGSRSVV